MLVRTAPTISCASLSSPGTPVARHTSLTVPTSSPDRGPFIVQDASIEIGASTAKKVVMYDVDPSGWIEDPTEGNAMSP